ncbi:hypothetical protein Tco_0791144 [Tanacetum coccineum]
MESQNSNSQERELHPLQQMQDKAKESCIVSFRLLHLHLTALSNNDLKGTSIEGGFEREFATLFEQDVQTFTRTMFVNLDQLEKHLSKEEFQELESSSAFRYFIAYTMTSVPLFQDKLIQHMESLRELIQKKAKHKQEYDRRMNDIMMQSKEGNAYSSKTLDAGLVVTESNETETERHVLSSRSGKDTHAEDADINSMNDKQPMAEVQLTAEHNILANEQQHYEQSESIYDTYLLEKGFMKSVSDDPSYVTGDEPKYPQELFLAVDLLSLQFLVLVFYYAGDVSFVMIMEKLVVVGGVPSIIKLSVCDHWAGHMQFYQYKASSFKVPLQMHSVFLANTCYEKILIQMYKPADEVNSSFCLVFLLGLLALAMAVVCASRAAVKSAISCRMASKVMAGVSDVDVLLGGILSTQDNA